MALYFHFPIYFYHFPIPNIEHFSSFIFLFNFFLPTDSAFLALNSTNFRTQEITFLTFQLLNAITALLWFIFHLI